MLNPAGGQKRTPKIGPTVKVELVSGPPLSAGPGEMAPGEDNSILDWREWVVCSRYKSREGDMVSTGTARR